MNDAQRRTFQENLELDFAYTLDDRLRFRVNAFVHNRGEGAVLRTIPSEIPRLEELGLPPVIKSFCNAEKGLVLVTGPTGCGKTTTLGGDGRLHQRTRCRSHPYDRRPDRVRPPAQSSA